MVALVHFFTLLTFISTALAIAAHGPHTRRSRHRALSPRASIPSGWSYQGCYSDPGDARLLSAKVYSGSSNSPSSCIARCQDAGFAYAGVEYGIECWCGSPSHNLSPATCNVQCSGDSSQICGGGYALSLYHKSGSTTKPSSANPATGFKYLGCYVDSANRILAGASSSSNTMTNAACQSTCSNQGFQFAGTENGNECYCSKSKPAGSPVSDNDCSSSCKGDSSSKCGGGWRVSVYGPSSSNSNPAPNPNVPSTISWSGLGCYADQAARTLSGASFIDYQGMTIAQCQAKCAGFTYAGVEYGGECYCGNTLTSQAKSTACNVPCAGDKSKTCGGPWSLNVYQQGGKPTGTITLGPATSSPASGSYTAVGCYRDSSNRALASGQGVDNSGRTQQSCFARCTAQGYCYAGLENGNECWCGDSIKASSNSGNKIDDGQCSTPCTGNRGTKCGGGWALSVFYDKSKPNNVGAGNPKPSTGNASGSWWRSNGSNSGKIIIAHFIVGNAYSYTPDQWRSEILSAHSQGIDAFALNFGYDSWQPGQMQAAYDAAAASGVGFKMLLSFDMTTLSCSDNDIVTSNIKKYANHPGQLKDSSGAMWVSTFDGGLCRNNAQWQDLVKNQGVPTRFIPAFFNDLTNSVMKQMFPVMNGDFLWGGAWPKGDNPIDWSEDAYRISRDGLSRPGDIYMTSVSPWFFVHYPGRNYIWRGDDFLYPSRWEDLVTHRDQVDAVEVVSWNDYGESTYIGPIGKDQPGSQAWVSGFDHTPFLQMTGYYATAFKTGQWPSITADKIFIWGRPHPRDANAPDGLGKPDKYTWTDDKLWVVLYSTGSGTLTVTQGSSSTTAQVQAGVNKISLNLAPASGVSTVLTRNGGQVFSFSAPISYTTNPSSYNYNINAAAGP